ncbi:MAG: glycosyltransferase [Chitinophagales bacterium]|nr:glycosyltransferase [Chitinophagales bacterium]
MKILFLHPKAKVSNNHDLPISVIICAHNEEENLKSYLSQILEQDYIDFEVIVVNDGSTDGTLDVLHYYEKQYPHLRIISIHESEKMTFGKKRALDLGIQNAKNPYLLLTDADCFPESSYWIAKMSKYFDEKHRMVLGVAPYCHNVSFLHDIIRYETITTLIQYVNYALWHIPYMGVGRNLGYTKELYNEVGGMSSHENIISGDDDLFVQQAVQYTQVAVCMEKETYLYSQAPDTWKKWWKQKTRHYTTGGWYSWKHQLLLGLFIASKVLVYLIIIYFILLGIMNINIVSTFVVFLSLMSIIVHLISHKYSLGIKGFQVVYLDIIFVMTMIVQGIQSKMIHRKDWK